MREIAQHCTAQLPKEIDRHCGPWLHSIQITQRVEQKSRETKLQKPNPSILQIVAQIAEDLQPPRGRLQKTYNPHKAACRKLTSPTRPPKFEAALLQKENHRRKITDHLEEEADDDDVIIVLNSSKLMSPSPFLSTPVIMFLQSSRVLPSPMPLRTW